MWVLALLLVASAANDATIDIEVRAPSERQARDLVREPWLVYDRRGTVVRAYGDAAMLASLRARGWPVTVLSSDYRARLGQVTAPTRSAAYVSIDDLPARLESLASLEPGARVERWGESVDGRPLLALRIGAGRGHAVRILGGHHGDERPSIDCVLTLATDYIDRLHNDPVFAASAGEVVFMPVVNPDGAVRLTRHNAHGVDLNRNYNFEFRHDEFAAGATAFSEPESRAVALDNEYHRYAVSLTFHSGAFNIGYPFNYEVGGRSSDAPFLALATRYQQLVPDPTFWVTRGADWYVSYGDTNDYSWGHFGGIDFTVEMHAPDKSPPPDQLAGLISLQRAASFDWLDLGLTSLRFTVHTKEGLTVPAVVTTATLRAVANELDGAVEILAASGEPATVSYPGYQAQGVALQAGLDVVLEPQLGGRLGRLVRVDGGVRIEDSLSVFTSLVAHRPGENEMVLPCMADGAGWSCTLPSGTWRPGAYSVTATTAEGSYTWVRALWLDDVTSAGAVHATWADDAFSVTDWGPATSRFVLRPDGAVTALTTESAVSAPAGSRLVWAENGRLHSLLQALPTATDTPVAPALTPPKRRGCAATGSGDWLGLALALVVLCKKRRNNDSRDPRHLGVAVVTQPHVAFDPRARSFARVGRTGVSRRH